MFDPDLIDSMDAQHQPLVRKALAVLVSSGLVEKQLERLTTQVVQGTHLEDEVELAKRIISLRHKTGLLRGLIELGMSFIKEQNHEKD